MKQVLAFVLTVLFVTAAVADHCGRSHCSWKHCDRHCPRVVTVTNTVTRTVTVTNTIDRMPILPLAIRDYPLQANHVYRILYSSEGVEWHRFAIFRIKTNQVARIIQAPGPLLFQMRDVTPGFEGTVIESMDPEGDAVCYLIRRKGVVLRLN